MDTTLKAVLLYVKTADFSNNWRDLRDKVFAELYHPDMAFLDVFQVLLRAYEQAVMEPRFQLPGGHHAADDLLLSPVKGVHSIGFPFPSNDMDTQCSIEQFYGAMIKCMISNLRLTRVDWCRDELGISWPAAMNEEAVLLGGDPSQE